MDQLLTQWDLSHLKDYFVKAGITVDILKLSEISDLRPILKNFSVGDQIKFKIKFKEFLKKGDDLEVCVKTVDPSTIEECKKKIVAQQTNLSITTEEAINLYLKLSFTYKALDEVPLVNMDFVNKSLRQVITLSIDHNNFSKNLKSPKGILLYGPPGSGKTRAIQNFKKNFQHTFFTVTPNTFGTKNDSGIDANSLFELATILQPTVIFFEEAHGTFGRQSTKFKFQLKMEIDKLSQDHKVFIIAATNSMDTFDESFAKRFPKKIYLDLPDQEERLKLLKYFTSNFKTEDLDLNPIAKKTKNFTNSDLEFVCNDAHLIATDSYLYESDGALKSKRPENVIVTQADIMTSIHWFKPTMTVEALELHKKILK